MAEVASARPSRPSSGFSRGSFSGTAPTSRSGSGRRGSVAGSRQVSRPSSAQRRIEEESKRAEQQRQAALNLLQPARRKLATVEAERVLTVVDLLVSRVRLLPALSCDNAKLDSIKQQLSPEIRRALAEHHRLEMNCVDPADTKQAVTLGHSVRSLLRLVTNDPAAAQLVASVAPELDAQTHQLLDQLNAFRTSIFERLATQHEEAVARSQLLDNLGRKKTRASEQIEELQAKVKEAVAKREEEFRRRSEVVESLREEIETVLAASSEATRKTEKEARKREKQEVQALSAEKETVNGQIDALEKELQEVKQENKSAEEQQRRRKIKLEGEVENWIKKYDMEMGEKQDEMDKIQEQYDGELAQLRELQARYEVLFKEYSAIMEERRLEKERQDKAEADLIRMSKAAIVIQRNWARFKAAKAAEKAAKKKSSAKKKKGGKKK